MKIPKFLVRFGCFLANLWFRLLGDKKPDTYAAVLSLKTDSARKFNEEIRDREGIFYQSYAFVMKNPLSDIFFLIPSAFVWLIEGENDGLLTPAAVRWGEFRGIYRTKGRSWWCRRRTNQSSGCRKQRRG